MARRAGRCVHLLVELTRSGRAPAEYKAKSPLSKIPCWEEGDLVLPDSSVILSYLEHGHPEPPLLPAEPGRRARALWFEEYADTKVAVTLSTVFFERVVRPAVFQQETNQAVVDQVLNGGVPEVFDYLSGCLGDDEYMVGGAFSLADIALTSPFVNFAIAGESVDAGQLASGRGLRGAHSRPAVLRPDRGGRSSRALRREDSNGPAGRRRARIKVLMRVEVVLVAQQVADKDRTEPGAEIRDEA